MTDETEMMSVIAGHLENLFNTAHKDPELKRRLLSQPAEVAKEWNVQLDKRDVERLTKIGYLQRLRAKSE
jgi:hypothetical protein